MQRHFRMTCLSKFTKYNAFLKSAFAYYLFNFVSKMNTKQIYGAVLLVCIYNRYGNVITHDYFYQIFSQYGQIVKILIFQKAKVWKTFIQFADQDSARKALINLDNHVVFEDGSKMNIYSSKLKHINLQNQNLGGVNYERLRYDNEPQTNGEYQKIRSRKNTNPETICKYFGNQQVEKAISFSKAPQLDERTVNSYGSSGNKKSSNQFNSFSIDQQFLQLARQSQQFRELQKYKQNQQTQIKTRLKSKTMIPNPNLEQFLKQNSPCKVLFIRSIPQGFDNKVLYNIFNNFGNIKKIIYLKEKQNGLIQFESIQDAILAKDQLNYSKPQMKVFYSHYETLNMSQNEGQIYYVQSKQHSSKPKFVNPPSQVLYLTMVTPNQEQQIKQKCQKIGVTIYNACWKNINNRWSCLADFGTIDHSLLVMGFLQGSVMKSGKSLKVSFTKQKINRMTY